MASDYSILGQSAPAATTNTNVYTVPAATQAVISSIIIANGAATDGTFKMWARVAGATVVQAQVLFDTVTVPANDSIPMTHGITLGAGDIITVYCSSADMSVNVFGLEIS